MGLDQAIAVEEGAIAGLQRCLLLLIGYAGHEPQRHPPSPQLLGLAVMLPAREVVSCVRIAQVPVRRVKDAIEAGDENMLEGMSATNASLTRLSTSPGDSKD